MTTREPLESELKRRTRFGALRHVATCSSTQDLAEEAAKEIRGAPHDAVFWADHQEQGRGRGEEKLKGSSHQVGGGGVRAE